MKRSVNTIPEQNAMPDRRHVIGVLAGAFAAGLAPRIALASVTRARAAPATPGSLGGLLQTAQQVVSALGEARFQFALVSQQFGLHTHTYEAWQTGMERITVDHDIAVSVLMCPGSPQTQTTGKTTAVVPAIPASTTPLLVNITSPDQLVAMFPSFDHDVAGFAKVVTNFQQAYSAHTHPYLFNASGIAQESSGGNLYRFATPTASSGNATTGAPNNVATLVGRQAPSAPYDSSAQQEYLDGMNAFVAALLSDVKAISTAMAAHAHSYAFNNFSPQPVLPKPFTITACVINGTQNPLTSVATVPKLQF